MTTEHIYVFESGKVSRRHKITRVNAIIKSKVSNQIVLNFPGQKDLRIEGLSRELVTDLQSMLQLRFIAKDPVNTLKIFEVN